MRPIGILLLVGFAVMIAANWGQQLYYLRTVNRLANGEQRPGRILVSGRASGRLRGAVALLIVRQADDVVEHALVMEGTTVFARFRERPELAGPAGEEPPEALSKAARTAVANAVAHYRRMTTRPEPEPEPDARSEASSEARSEARSEAPTEAAGPS